MKAPLPIPNRALAEAFLRGFYKCFTRSGLRALHSYVIIFYKGRTVIRSSQHLKRKGGNNMTYRTIVIDYAPRAGESGIGLAIGLCVGPAMGGLRKDKKSEVQRDDEKQ